MSGIQETVALGLELLARRVREGRYGEGDYAFQGKNDCDGLVFLEDMHDEVLDKIE